MTLAEMPDYVWIPVVALLWAAVEVLKALALKIAARKVEVAADRVEAKVNDVHTLVNSDHGKTLFALAVAMRTIADNNPTPHNIKAAEMAERDSADHNAKQAQVDAKEN